MRLNQLKIQNFRCFESETVSFSPQFNLFIGVNGAGKTSLLRAVREFFVFAMFYSDSQKQWARLHEKESRIIMQEVEGRIRYEKAYPIIIEGWLNYFGSDTSWKIEESRDNAALPWNSMMVILKKMAADPVEGQSRTMPILAFYSAERNWLSSGMSADVAITQKEARFDGYQSWDQASNDAKNLEAWVIAKSLERLEALAAQAMPERHDADELDLTNHAIQQAIPQAQGLRYDIRQRLLVLDWKDGRCVPFDTLSDGQRGVVALVADIARRMALLNPHLGAQVLAQTPGIVLIDELDIHLHPAWQRRLPQMLKTVFPQIQFIATCHSPQMMGELPASEIWLMKAGQVVGHPERALGLSANQVLEELMDAPARNPEVTAQLAQIDRLLDTDDLAQAQPLVAALRAKVGDIPEVIAAQASIDSLRWLDDDAPNA